MPPMLKRIAIAIVCLSWALHAPAAAPGDQAGDWLDLFNGKDLDDWTVKLKGFAAGEDPYDTFRVADGLLSVSYDKYPDRSFGGRFGHLFYVAPFSHYVLHMEYRFTGKEAAGGPAWAKRNSGAMVHAQTPESMGRDQDFPISIEAQLLGGLDKARPRPTANVCTPGTDITVDNATYPHHCLVSSAATYFDGEWVNVTVVVLGGGSITHYVEGEEVLSYHLPRLDDGAAHQHTGAPRALQAGYIALQSESAPIEFRQVRLLNLTGCANPDAANFKPYVVNPDNSLCRYDDS